MSINEKRQIEIKQALGEKAATMVQSGMTIGLGTGTTATCFIQSLISRVKKGLLIKTVSSSIASLKLATEGGLPVLDMNSIDHIDLMVDGADEIDTQKRLIKGKGGALLREKIMARASSKLIIIADESKQVDSLGKCGLPVEIVSFGYKSTIAELSRLGYEGSLREKGGKPFVSDNGNFLFDIQTPSHFSNPEKNHIEILEVPGVVETGFFFNLATSILIGYADGNVRLLE